MFFGCGSLTMLCAYEEVSCGVFCGYCGDTVCMSNISEGNPAASDQPVSFGSVPLAEQSQSQPQSQVEGVSYSNMGMVGVGPQPVAASRYPGPVECQTCGCTPAVPVTIRRLFGTVVTGVFFWQTRRGPYCQLCGLAEYNTGQHITATIGICGPIAIFLAGPFLLLNRKSRQLLERMPGPANRDPNVYTGDRVVPRNPGKPVARRVTAYLPILAIVTLVTLMFISTPTLKTPQELKATYMGTCWNSTSPSREFVKQVPCTADAQYVAVAVVPTDADCPAVTNVVTTVGTKLVACLVNRDELQTTPG